MMENPPDMAKLAIDVQKKCPKEASEDGVTIMLGKFHNFCEAIKIDRLQGVWLQYAASRCAVWSNTARTEQAESGET